MKYLLDDNLIRSKHVVKVSFIKVATSTPTVYRGKKRSCTSETTPGNYIVNQCDRMMQYNK
jgi:hypothetical protein